MSWDMGWVMGWGMGRNMGQKFVVIQRQVTGWVIGVRTSEMTGNNMIMAQIMRG